MIDLPTVVAARKAVRVKKATRLEAFVNDFQPLDPESARTWRRELRALLIDIESENVPCWKHWTEVFGRPGNWRELAPETQQRWIGGRYDMLKRTPEWANRQILLSIARNEALASVGRSLGGDQ